MSAKPFSLVVQLVKSQIRIEKLLRANPIADSVGALALLEEKYPWIKNPLPPEKQKVVAPQPRQQRQKYRVVQELPSEQQRKAQKPQKEKVTQSVVAKTTVQAPAAKVPSAPANRAPAQTEEMPLKQPGQEMQESNANDQGAYPEGGAGDERMPCKHCGRRFDPARVQQHEKTCQKNPEVMAKKKGRTAMVFKNEFTSGAADGPVQKKPGIK